MRSGSRRVNVGGEVATRSLVDRLSAQPGVETVVNVYGPTECTVFCATHVIGRAENGNPPIGQPVAGSELTVRDADQRVVDDGTPGELWVAGPLVGRGYLDPIGVVMAGAAGAAADAPLLTAGASIARTRPPPELDPLFELAV